MKKVYNLGVRTVQKHRVVCAFVVRIQHNQVFSQGHPQSMPTSDFEAGFLQIIRPKILNSA